MKQILIHYDNGDTIRTRINATVQQIVSMYLDRVTVFNNGDGPETTATARCIEFLDAPARKPWKAAKYAQQLARVYSISPEYMKRHDLHSKHRCTVRQFDDFMPTVETSDFAYIPGALEY